MNFLNDYPKVRKWLYFVQWVVNGILAIFAAYFAATGVAVDALPTWYVVTLAIAPVVWTYTGLQAGANTPVDSPPPPYVEGGYALLGALGVGLIVLTILLLVLTLLKVVAVSYVVLVVLFVIGVVLVLVDGRRVL